MRNIPDADKESALDLFSLEQGRRKAPAYYDEVDRLYRYLIPSGHRVLELGCGTGRLLAATAPAYGLGIDIDPDKVEKARSLHAGQDALEFRTGDVEQMDFSELGLFDYIIISDLLPLLRDIQGAFNRLRPICHPSTRIITSFHSNLWKPLFTLATSLGLREPIPDYNWLSSDDISNLFHLSGFEAVSKGSRLLLPLRIPGLKWTFNRLLAKLPLLRTGCMSWHIVARPMAAPLPSRGPKAPTVSILVPTLNERGNIEDLFLRTPRMGRWTELVFVDGNSDDGTVEEIDRCAKKYGRQWKRIKRLQQSGKGKAQAVRQGFEECRGDILMILDSDLTMPPEDLPKYFDTMITGKGEFINGCRLIYPMEDEAMRFINMVGNHFFGLLFSYLLNQRVKDTLCGTKAMWRRDYEVLAANRSYFGDFDPFGDFDLLLGAAKMNLKIVDLPIRYRNRSYGEIKIDRWSSSLLLFRMSWLAFKKLVKA